MEVVCPVAVYYANAKSSTDDNDAITVGYFLSHTGGHSAKKISEGYGSIAPEGDGEDTDSSHVNTAKVTNIFGFAVATNKWVTVAGTEGTEGSIYGYDATLAKVVTSHSEVKGYIVVAETSNSTLFIFNFHEPTGLSKNIGVNCNIPGDVTAEASGGTDEVICKVSASAADSDSEGLRGPV